MLKFDALTSRLVAVSGGEKFCWNQPSPVLVKVVFTLCSHGEDEEDEGRSNGVAERRDAARRGRQRWGRPLIIMAGMTICLLLLPQIPRALTYYSTYYGT